MPAAFVKTQVSEFPASVRGWHLFETGHSSEV